MIPGWSVASGLTGEVPYYPLPVPDTFVYRDTIDTNGPEAITVRTFGSATGFITPIKKEISVTVQLNGVFDFALIDRIE